MALYVLKFGGSSLATPARIKHVSEIISKLISNGNRVVVVTSAMQGTTNRLIDLTKSFSDTTFNREYDAVISTGEQIAAGLLAMCLNSIGYPAKSLNAWQILIKTTGNYSNAEISEVNKNKILEEVEKGIIPVITGFQGISENFDICTIGRGGSDATACAIANSINADECLIYTDVDGVYSADPRIVLNAKKIHEISYDDMIELAIWGAKVLQAKSTLIAKKYNVNLKVLSSFSEGSGTNVSNKTEYISNHNITGITHNLELSLLSLKNKKNHSDILNLIKPFNIINLGDEFLIPKASQTDLKALLAEKTINFEIDNDIGVTTIVGNFKFNKDILNKVSEITKKYEIILKRTLTSISSISLITSFQQTESFVNLLHKEFFEK